MKVKQGDTTKHYKTLWMEDGRIKMINQLLLPHTFEIHETTNHRCTTMAIQKMIVRGAGAIGAAGGYAMAQATKEAYSYGKIYGEKEFWKYIAHSKERIKSARPTASALTVAVDKVYTSMKEGKSLRSKMVLATTAAETFAYTDETACKIIGEHGADILEEIIGKEKEEYNILTHCNAGWLAFVDYGSALSPLYALKRRGKKLHVYVDETRPYNQGARLTAWELQNEQIPLTLVPDNHVGSLMAQGKVDAVIVGADRIAANGDTANKIGTYTVSLAAKAHGVPFFVAAPTHTFDFKMSSGKNISIEERSADEVTWVHGINKKGELDAVRIVPEGVNALYTGFDVTPYYNIKAFITEKGVFAYYQLLALAKNPKEVIVIYGK